MDFIGIGAQKAGTTWLYEHLRQHDKIKFPAGKEVHFWDRHSSKGIEWYKSLFKPFSGKLNGEITPAYAILDRPHIQQIYELNKDLRIFYIIRNPIERAWSAALMALGRAEMTIDEASDQWFIDHFNSAGSLKRSDYEGCIRTWRTVFSEDQIMILRYESLDESPRELLKMCCRHLGIGNGVYSAQDDALFRNVVFQGPGYKIRSSLLPVLIELYKQKILDLSVYLNEDFSGWLSL